MSVKRKIGWWLFCIKYKLGLAKEGKDFITIGEEYNNEQANV